MLKRLLTRMYTNSSNGNTSKWTYEQVKALAAATNHSPPTTNVHLIDVRQPAELASSGTIPAALNVPLARLQAFLDSDAVARRWRAAGDTVVFSCAKGLRAEEAAERAVAAGFKRVGVYYGSFTDWQRREGSVKQEQEQDQD